MKISISALKRVLRESFLFEDGAAGGQSLGQLLDAMASQFSAKMQSQYPQAGEVIPREAGELKTQLMATIRASAAKVKMAAGPGA